MSGSALVVVFRARANGRTPAAGVGVGAVVHAAARIIARAVRSARRVVEAARFETGSRERARDLWRELGGLSISMNARTRGFSFGHGRTPLV
jgi:hypothetical protein